MDGWVVDALKIAGILALWAVGHVIWWRHARSGAARRNRLRIRGKDRHRIITARDLWGSDSSWGGGPGGGGDFGDGDGGDGGGGDGGGGD